MEVTNDNSCSWIKDLNPRTSIKSISSNEECDWLIIGAGYTALNQFSNAINHYKAALKLEPKNAEVLNNLGLTFKAIGDFKKANDENN